MYNFIKGWTGQLLSKHVAVEKIEMQDVLTAKSSHFYLFLLLRVCSTIAQSYLCHSNEPLPNYQSWDIAYSVQKTLRIQWTVYIQSWDIASCKFLMHKCMSTSHEHFGPVEMFNQHMSQCSINICHNILTLT